MNDLQIVEGYPDDVRVRMKEREQKRIDALPGQLHGKALELVIEDLLLWDVDVLMVSFKGGNSILHGQIAEIATIWTNCANIRFDFGYNQETKKYREWVPDDVSSIRVGFEQAGYWSYVGMDSQDLEISKPGGITLNLEKFDVQLPLNWKTTVLHEFGHALGFHHEHQSPVSDCDFDWDTLYEYLGGPPNNWSKEQVDFNLREMPAGGLTYAPHDKHSIMHYAFPEWMFNSRSASPCFVTEPEGLSEEDKLMASKAYPFDQKQVLKMKADKQENLELLLEWSKDFQINPHLEHKSAPERIRSAETEGLEKQFKPLNTGLSDFVEKSNHLWKARLDFLKKRMLHEGVLQQKNDLNVSYRVKKEILIAGGQAGTDPGMLAESVMLDNVLPTSFAYQFLADRLNSLVGAYKTGAAVNLSEVQNCETVEDCISMVSSKI
jgi:hypothetical protein